MLSSNAMQTALCVLYFAVLLLLASYGLHRSHLVWTCLRLRRRLKEIRETSFAELDRDALPYVTIQLPLFNEATVAVRLLDHVARIVVMVRGADRDATLDATIATIVSAFPASETLGGAVDFVQVRPAEEVAPEVMDVAVGFKVAVVPLLILYTAPNAAG